MRFIRIFLKSPVIIVVIIILAILILCNIGLFSFDIAGSILRKNKNKVNSSSSTISSGSKAQDLAKARRIDENITNMNKTLKDLFR